jgi:hypothetical protein
MFASVAWRDALLENAMNFLLRRLFRALCPRPQARASRHARLEVEELSERLMRATVPSLAAVTRALDFVTTAPSHRQLKIVAETDNGNGNGSCTGQFTDSRFGFSASVSGNSTLKHVPNGVNSRVDYGLSYGGIGYSGLGNVYSEVIGGGDFTTASVNTPACSATQYTPGVSSGSYSGSDTEYGFSLHNLKGSYSVYMTAAVGNNDNDYPVEWIH